MQIERNRYRQREIYRERDINVQIDKQNFKKIYINKEKQNEINRIQKYTGQSKIKFMM